MSTLLAGDQKDTLLSKLFEIEQQIRQKDGYPFDPTELNDLLLRGIEGKFSSEILTISPCDGSRTIVNARSTFRSGVSFNFTNWGLDKPGTPTAETPVGVREMFEDANSNTIFTSHSLDLDKLVLTQDQIVGFCEEHPDWLRQDGKAILFLFKKDENKPATLNNLFVVHVHVRSDGLVANVDSIDSSRKWLARDRHRLVIPRKHKEPLLHPRSC